MLYSVILSWYFFHDFVFCEGFKGGAEFSGPDQPLFLISIETSSFFGHRSSQIGRQTAHQAWNYGRGTLFLLTKYLFYTSYS